VGSTHCDSLKPNGIGVIVNIHVVNKQIELKKELTVVLLGH
jgi:hypothetical protein